MLGELLGAGSAPFDSILDELLGLVAAVGQHMDIEMGGHRLGPKPDHRSQPEEWKGFRGHFHA